MFCRCVIVGPGAGAACGPFAPRFKEGSCEEGLRLTPGGEQEPFPLKPDGKSGACLPFPQIPLVSSARTRRGPMPPSAAISGLLYWHWSRGLGADRGFITVQPLSHFRGKCCELCPPEEGLRGRSHGASLAGGGRDGSPARQALGLDSRDSLVSRHLAVAFLLNLWLARWYLRVASKWRGKGPRTGRQTCGWSPALSLTGCVAWANPFPSVSLSFPIPSRRLDP